MEYEKAAQSDIFRIILPCGADAKISMRELENAALYGSWAPICFWKCPKHYGLRILLLCEDLRRALPLADFITSLRR